MLHEINADLGRLTFMPVLPHHALNFRLMIINP